MDSWWVRCGNCFSPASPLTSTIIFLTSCGHFVCNHCLHKTPLPKPATSGYCYDCKKPCSVVNLSIGDKLSPDIAFYFKDLNSLFQKMIEIENFQKLHRNKCMEDEMRSRLSEDIVKVQLYRERCLKYMPYFRQVHSLLCTKFGIKPTRENVDYSPMQIDSFLEELQAFLRQQQVTPSRGMVGGGVMEVDSRTPSHSSSCSNQATPMMQGSPAGSGGSTMITVGRPPSSLFRAHLQHGNSMPQPSGGPTLLGGRTPSTGGRMTFATGGGRRGPSGSNRIGLSTGVSKATPSAAGGRITPTSGGGRITPTSGGRITPTSGGRRITPTAGARLTPTSGGGRVTPTSGGRADAGRITPTAGGRTKPSPLLSSSRAIAQSVQATTKPHLLLPSSVRPPPVFTPTHARIRQVMLSSGPPRLPGGVAMPTSRDQQRPVNMPAVSKVPPGAWGQRTATPFGSSQRLMALPRAAGSIGRNTPPSSRLRQCKSVSAYTFICMAMWGR